LVQQAILQELEGIVDPTFSEWSYGFRRGRNAHQAVKQAAEYVAEGRVIVVDIDLEKFFDRVNHDILMARLARWVSDKRLLRIVRRFLEAGMMWDGVCIERYEGTPQGGPLSPLLANLVLDDLDKGLERRGHCFCRYGDDCNIYVRTQQAGERVIASVTRFLEERLRLRVNWEKSAVAYVAERQFLGIPAAARWAIRDCVPEPGAGQEADTGDYTTQPRSQHRADDPRTELVSDGVGDILSLCGVQDTPTTSGRVDTTETSLRTAQTTEKS
jgi:group II intron reverse transcriptase/maturase